MYFTKLLVVVATRLQIKWSYAELIFKNRMISLETKEDTQGKNKKQDMLLVVNVSNVIWIHDAGYCLAIALEDAFNMTSPKGKTKKFIRE